MITAPVMALKRSRSYLSTFISASSARSLHTDSKVTIRNLEPQIHSNLQKLGDFFFLPLWIYILKGLHSVCPLSLLVLFFRLIFSWTRCALLVWPRSWLWLLVCARSRGTSARTFLSARRFQISSSPVTEQVTNRSGDPWEWLKWVRTFCVIPRVCSGNPHWSGARFQPSWSWVAPGLLRTRTHLQRRSRTWARATPAPTPGRDKAWRCGRGWCKKASQAKRSSHGHLTPEMRERRAVRRCPSPRYTLLITHQNPLELLVLTLILTLH